MSLNPSGPWIRRPVMTTLVMAAILFFGTLSYQMLPVSDLPNVDYPTIQVTTSYPGANPETVANNVTSVLEKEFTTVDGIALILSQSAQGDSQIVLQFDISKSIESAAVDVQAAINQAQALLPSNLPSLPTYSKVNPSASPILYLAVTSPTVPLATLYEYGRNILGERLNMINGVAQVQAFGSPYAPRVRLDPRKLAARKMGIEEVASAIISQNVNHPTGMLFGPTTEYTLQTDGQLLNAEKYNEIILRSDDQTITRLRDVGYAIDGVQFDKYRLMYTEGGLSQPTVVLAIRKQGGANTLDIVHEIEKLLPKLQKDIPQSIEIKKIFDRAVYINEAVFDVEFTLLIAFLLVLVVIFVYLGEWIATVIPSLALPMSVIGTFALMHRLGFSVDILSLLAITLSVGFLVDDAIVVLENIARHIEQGKKTLDAAIDGSREIAFTIVSMTMCLIAVFIPLIFMGGVLGIVFREFAITIIVAILFSGFISLSLTPMLSSRFLRPHHQGREKTLIERLSEGVNAFLLRLYLPSLQWALRHRMMILSSGVASLGLTIYLLIALPKDFLPPDDLGFIAVFTETADGTSPFLTQDYTTKLVDILATNPSIESMVSIGAVPQDNQGLLFLRLVPLQQRPPISTVVDALLQETARIPGLKVFYKPIPLIELSVGTSQAQANYQYTMHSLNIEQLYQAAEKMREQITHSPTFMQVNSDLHLNQPQWRMEILRDKASLLHVSAASVQQALNLAYANSQLSPISTPQNQYYVIMETLPEFYKNPHALRQLYVRSTKDTLVQLHNIVNMQEEIGPLTVNHINGLPSVTLTFDVARGVPLGTAVNELDELAKNTLPDTVTGTLQGTADVFRSAFANLHWLLIITIFVIYVILGILYENFLHPITVMSTLPPAALGGLLTLTLFGLPISLYAFIGIIMLLGIVMKNGIIMIDFANEQRKKENLSIHDAIAQACSLRFRPIVMTTMAAMMGAVPIALGIGGMTALSRQPLGIVIVGGLLFSQVLTLYLTPVIYIVLEELRTSMSPRHIEE